jgi:hypothetical protein
MKNSDMTLECLLKRVEANEFPGDSILAMGSQKHIDLAQDANHKDVHAAFLLMKSALPNWAIDKMTVWPGGDTSLNLIDTHEMDGERWHDIKGKRVSARHKVTSVAILIAILRALIEAEK